LLIFYDWFYPGYKAGGPIQSLTNLVTTLVTEFDIFVITSVFDLNSSLPYPNVTPNRWNIVTLPGAEKPVNIYYATKQELGKKKLRQLFATANPQAIFLNGVFSYRFFLLPLLTARSVESNCKIVVSARGMLKKGALAGKFFKKKMYLWYLRIAALLDNVTWHATNQEEADDIHRNFPANRGIVIATNIPKSPYDTISYPTKLKGQLRLVYLSLINEHKNLFLSLELIKDIDGVTLDVYGPIIDQEYWSKCVALIQQMPSKVKYKGEVEPAKVQEVISNYHAFILFTKGENFGHAIYESLSVGRPVITSNFTPWTNLLEKNAGVNVAINDTADCKNKIEFFSKMEQEEYSEYCTSAHAVAVAYFNNLDVKKKYIEMFQ
jgi:glycosyltransferase involved in cell wall biosynthesis